MCGPLLGRTATGGGLVASIPCLSCGRNLRIDVSEEAFQTEETQETLRRYGRAVAAIKKMPAALFTFKLDDRVIMSDPECGCEDTETCPHKRMLIRLESSEDNS